MSWLSDGRELASNSEEAPIRLVSSTRVFPQKAYFAPTSPQTIPLSILDATCANFEAASTILYFDTPRITLNYLSHMKWSLSKTLNAYPHLCGRVHFSDYHYSSYKPEDGHTHRFGRLFQTFGKESDPGVELRMVTYPHPLSEFLPDTAGRRKGGHWDPSGLPSTECLSPTTLALSDFYGDTSSLPCFTIQLTQFSCGSIAIGFRLTHVLADAVSLANFIHDWAAVSRAMMGNNLPIPTLSPLFEPQLLDRKAAGDIDAIEPDAELIRKSRSLNCHRFDWYAFEDGRPFGETKIPDGIDARSVHPLATVMPWDTWDVTSSTLTSILHFSASETQGMWKEAKIGTQSFVSKHDAIVAHIWKLINRARKIEDDQDVHIDYTIGFRDRLLLPDSFMGSPIMMANIAMKGRDVTEKPISEIALKIRSEVGKYDAEHIKALLHDEAFEENPRRYWRGFLGKRHMLATSWIRTRLYEVDFGMKSILRFVDTPLTPLDGLLLVMEAAPAKGKNEAGSWPDRQHWSENGVDLRLSLETEVMERLLKDPLRTKYSRTVGDREIDGA